MDHQLDDQEVEWMMREDVHSETREQDFVQLYSGGSRGVRSSSDEPPFFPSDQLTASNFSTPKISVFYGNPAFADFIYIVNMGIAAEEAASSSFISSLKRLEKLARCAKGQILTQYCSANSK